MNLKDLHLHRGQCRYKGNVCRSYSLARAYRENGKNRKEIIYKLGKLTEEEVVKWRSLLKGVKEDDVIVTKPENLKVVEHFAYLDVAVANAVWDYWQLDDVMKNSGCRDIGIAATARILTVNRCIDPVSKSQTPEWVRQTALPWMIGIDKELVNASRIFRELENIECHKEAVSDHIFLIITDLGDGRESRLKKLISEGCEANSHDNGIC